MMKRARTSRPLEHDEVVWRLLILNGTSEGEETKEDGWNAAEELFIAGYAVSWSESGYTATKNGQSLTGWDYRNQQQIIKWMDERKAAKESGKFDEYQILKWKRPRERQSNEPGQH